jgi:hypothetical protein
MTGPAEIALAQKNNGGAEFHLLKPLTLTANDFTGTKLRHDTITSGGKTEIKDTLVPVGALQLMLVFNPEDFLIAWDSITAANVPNKGELMGPNGVGNIKVPFLDATAIPCRLGDEIWRETYVFTGENNLMPGNFFRVRLEIYSIGDNIVAASTRALVGPNGEFPVEPDKVISVKDEAGGTFRVENNKQNPIVEGFHRLTTAGETGNANLTLSMIHVDAAAYTMVEKRKIN